MTRIAALLTLSVALFASTLFAQPVCDITTYSSTPSLTYTKNNGAVYNTWTSGSRNWEIINTSNIANPTSSPYVLHTNPGSGNGSQSPQWLISQQITGFNWQYNEMQWSFWFGRRANNGQNGGNQDRSTVWLYINNNTGITNLTGLEGIRLTWHHNNNTDAMQLVEVYGGVEHIIADFVLLANLCNYEWGTTVVVNRIPAGTPTGSRVRWQVRLSPPVPTPPQFSSYNEPADSDPIATAVYLRVDTLLSTLNTWHPSSTTGRIGVMSDYASSRKNAAEYNQICITDKGPAPVELTSFAASYRNDAVTLKWKTATENNNYGFEIERSLNNGKAWETIGFSEGAGNSSSEHSYMFEDHSNFGAASTAAYRLKQIDRDGSYEYSNTVTVSIANAASGALYNFPNPFNPATSISFTLQHSDIVTLAVYNAAGERVAELLRNESLNAGTHTASFNGSDLPSGRYIYTLTTSEGATTNSMVLAK